jgi:ABC-type transporter Mla subunit MlaD
VSNQVKVGLFTLFALAGIVAVYYMLSNFQHTGYQMAVHFQNTNGLQIGSAVQLAGVDVGAVTDIQLLPDQTAAVICNINEKNTIYRESAFVITTTLTGQSSVQIFPPKNLADATPLPHRILPEEQMPNGTLPPSLADLASAGQARLKELDVTLAVVNRELPHIVGEFNLLALHSDALVVHTDETLQQLAGELNATIGQVDRVVAVGGQNLIGVTQDVHGLVSSNRTELNEMIRNLAATSASAQQSMKALAEITSDPSLKQSLLSTAANVADATAQLKAIAGDIHSITGDPNVQSNLRGAVGNLATAIARADDLLSNFSSAQGGTQGSPGQTLPAPSGSPAPYGSPGPNGSPAPPQFVRRRGGGGFVLATAQVRETWSNAGGGPASDVAITLLPRLPMHATIGADDLGYSTKYDFLIDSARSSGLTLSGGILYSTLGVKAVVDPNGLLAVDARVYDPKHPKFDLYGQLRLSQRLQLFYGERNIFFGNGTRTPSFGFQVKT